MEIKTKRIYETPDERDGYRILVDRIWPRGMSKEAAGVDLWLKEIGPSHGLRKWYGHDPTRWIEFKRRYFLELDDLPDEIALVLEKAAEGPLTLIYSAKDTERNQAVAIWEYLENKPAYRD